uniref:Candidate secreted effector n=1 Tax=Meloidogyne incognita TaxID=6306 RepID=A0A914LL05_MELIC
MCKRVFSIFLRICRSFFRHFSDCFVMFIVNIFLICRSFILFILIFRWLFSDFIYWLSFFLIIFLFACRVLFSIFLRILRWVLGIYRFMFDLTFIIFLFMCRSLFIITSC